MHTLLMLTKFYPFGTGEAFIENEIEVFEKHFKKIVIIACEVPHDQSHIRLTPPNVVVYKVTLKNQKIQHMLDGIRGLGQIINATEEVKNEFSLCNNLLQKMFLYYFEEKSSRVFRTIQDEGFLDCLKNERFILYSYWFFMTARVGVKVRNLLPQNVIYSLCRAHRYDLYADRNLLNYLPYRELFLKSYDNVFPCSKNGSDYLNKLYFGYESKIKTALLGTLDRGLANSSTDGIFRIVSCSRLEDVKRVERIVEALSLLDDGISNIEWTHIGGGKNYKKIEDLVTKKIKNIKINLKGDIPNQGVLEFYTKNPLDLFINVSASEGLPVSIMEAISFGIPVVATDVGGTSEIVINNVTGQLISKEFTNRDLAEIILYVIQLKNRETYSQLRAKTRALWEKQFQANKNYSMLLEFIENRIQLSYD